MPSALHAIRAAILAQLTGDPTLVDLLSGGPIGYRPRQEPPMFPSVTFFDFGAWDLVPVTRRTVQVDIWDTNLNRAELIAERIRTLLDFNQARTAGLPPAQVPDGGPARIDYFGIDGDDNDLMAESEEGDADNQRLEFRLIATRLA